MKNYDIIIVGGSLAGIATASAFYNSNHSVLIIEKQPLGRYKACAGGFTRKSIRLMDKLTEHTKFDYKSQIKFNAVDMVISRKGKIKKVHGHGTAVAMMERTEFDNAFLQSVLCDNIDMMDNTKIDSIEYDSNIFTVTIGDQKFTSRFLIGADGVHSQVNKTFNIVAKSYKGFGIETICPKPKNVKFDMEYDFDDELKGYFWIFPKGDYLCVGAYSVLPQISCVTDMLRDYMDSKGLQQTQKITGHPIPFYAIAYQQPMFPCVLVGDATGFADKFTGEGIYYALKSGQLIGEYISNVLDFDLEFDPLEVQKIYKEKLITSLKVGETIADKFYNNMSIMYPLISSKLITVIFYDGFSNGHRYKGLFKKAPVTIYKHLKKAKKVKRHISNKRDKL